MTAVWLMRFSALCIRNFRHAQIGLVPLSLLHGEHMNQNAELAAVGTIIASPHVQVAGCIKTLPQSLFCLKFAITIRCGVQLEMHMICVQWAMAAMA